MIDLWPLSWSYIPDQDCLPLMSCLGPLDGSYNADETRWHLCWAWCYLERASRYIKTSCCLFEVCGLWETLEKSAAWAEASRLCRRALKSLQPAGWVSWAGQWLRESPGWTGVSKVNTELRCGTHLCQICWVEGGFNKGTMTPASISVPRENCSDPALTALDLKLVNLVLHMTLTLCKLLSFQIFSTLTQSIVSLKHNPC